MSDVRSLKEFQQGGLPAAVGALQSQPVPGLQGEGQRPAGLLFPVKKGEGDFEEKTAPGSFPEPFCYSRETLHYPRPGPFGNVYLALCSK